MPMGIYKRKPFTKEHVKKIVASKKGMKYNIVNPHGPYSVEEKRKLSITLHGDKYKDDDFSLPYPKRLRLRVLNHYSNGTLQCKCCGEKIYEFLCLDHIKGGGNKERKKTGYGPKLYLWLIKNDFPIGYQVLCHNCNLAKGFYGKCPHVVI